MLRLLFSTIAGAITALSFEPFGYYFISFFSIAVLFNYWYTGTAKGNFITGVAFGMGLFCVGVSWIYVSLHQFGGMPMWMGYIAVIGFALLLALFIGLAGFFVAYLFPVKERARINKARLLAMPCLWLIFEWSKGWVLTGFPWLELGVAQTSSPLFAFAPIGGVYLVSFTSVLVSLCLFMLTKAHYRIQSIILLVVLAAATILVNQFNWSKPIGEPVKITAVQGNIPIEDKWKRGFRNSVINQYASLTAQSHAQNMETGAADLIVWPETALPLYVEHLDNNFWRNVTPKGTALLTGLMDHVEPNKEYNAALLYCDNKTQVYRKHHLVPFGEYLPLRFLFGWLLDYLQLPMSDFSSWQEPQTLSCGANLNIGLSICYEDAFANELRKSIDESVSILINISEDAWFGDSFAPHQRLQMAQMRAKELARPLVRSANTGPSVFIDENGKVIAKSKQFEALTITHLIQPNSAKTPYFRFGNWVIFLSFAALILLLLFRKKD